MISQQIRQRAQKRMEPFPLQAVTYWSLVRRLKDFLFQSWHENWVISFNYTYMLEKSGQIWMPSPVTQLLSLFPYMLLCNALIDGAGVTVARACYTHPHIQTPPTASCLRCLSPSPLKGAVGDKSSGALKWPRLKRSAPLRSARWRGGSNGTEHLFSSFIRKVSLSD